VYDKVVGFSDTWTVHRLYVPGVAVGGKVLDIPLPYQPPPIEVGGIDEQTLQASNKLSDPALGSFAEIARAGGAFAFLSGEWETDGADGDTSNRSEEPHVDKVSEYQNLSKRPIRDSGMVADVSYPEIGVVKGGSVVWRIGRSAGSANHLRGSFRTWWQMTKSIGFPVLTKIDRIDLIVSMVPVDGGPATAASLNNCLSGPGARLQKPKHKITDDEVRGKLAIVGVNYDPSLAVPGAHNTLRACFRVSTVKDGKVGSYNEIATTLSSDKYKKDVYSSELTSNTGATFRSGLWDVNGAVGVKFRVEAFYDFGIETSGLDSTPFESYLRGRLDNPHLELSMGRPSFLNPWPLGDLIKNGAESRCFAFDYDGVGRSDHIACYKPGTRMLFYGREPENTFRFSPHYDKDGSYDLLSEDAACRMSNAADRAFAFDYESAGKLDHLVLYRPGRRACFIVRHKGGNDFEALPGAQVNSSDSKGIGGFDLQSPNDRAFAFDFDGFGKLDHLALYRAGSGNFVLFK
jgi:hypothetical protein